MQIQFPTTASIPALTRLATSLPWAVNDMLLAEVVGTTPENFTQLAIGDRLVLARSETPLAVGQKLNLTVAATGTTTILKVLPTTGSTVAEPIDLGLARVLPQQASAEHTQQLLRGLDELAAQPQLLRDVVGRDAAPRLAQAITTLLADLPEASRISDPPTLRKAVEDVALPTEARVMGALDSHKPPQLNGDLRAHFARLGNELAALPPRQREALTRAVHELMTTTTTAPPVVDDRASVATLSADSSPPGDLQSMVEGAAARLEANQLQSMTPTAQGMTPLVVDLPLAREGHTDLLHLEVESEARASNVESAPRTSVTLKLRLDGGHEFSARLQLCGDSLSVRLGSTDADFNDRISSRINELEDGLHGAGLSVNQLLVAPVNVSPRPRIGARQLINEKV